MSAIAQAHGGTAAETSEPGSTTFTVTLRGAGLRSAGRFDHDLRARLGGADVEVTQFVVLALAHLTADHGVEAGALEFGLEDLEIVDVALVVSERADRDADQVDRVLDYQTQVAVGASQLTLDAARSGEVPRRAS